MYEVALAVQHDVTIVSVFYLQQEEQQAVSSHTADEVVPRLRRKSIRMGAARKKVQFVEFIQKICTRM